MTEGLRYYDWDVEYRSSEGALTEKFYTPALDRSQTYDRAVGYFRSSTFLLTKTAMSNFALNGGKMRLICSPALTEQDLTTIKNFHEQTDVLIHNRLKGDIETALADPAEYSSLQLLATLLEFNILDLRITYKPKEEKPGIFHTKLGIFSDGQDDLTFGGSANETYMAWSQNEENLTPHFSWENDLDLKRTKADVDYFERLWNSEVTGFKTQTLPEISTEELRNHSLSDPQEANEKVLLEVHNREPTKPSGNKKKKTQKKPMAHQAQVRDNWLAQGNRGIVCFVTGGGKTVAAITIINEWFLRHPEGSVIVVVPSNLLSKQWVQELEEMEPKPSILKVGGEDSDSNWKDELPNFTRKASISTQRIVVAVVNSASSDDFLRFARVDEHTLLVADEVHTTGANNRRKVLTLEAGGRLGLSATPERFRDEEGTNAIFDYFGAKLEPEFTLKDAQNSDPPRLVTYVYEPETLPLTPDEYQNWLKETETIGKLAAQLNKSPSQDLENKLQMALIRRSRIIKSAAAKSDFAITCLVENFEEGQRWLVYCDTQEQLEEIKIKIGNELSLSGETSEYTSSMYFDKEATISIFGNRGGILLAIKCLDEGVDIPSITHALILASSLNPREHIQRRGRVLRTAPGKTQAVIYDALISPTETEPNSVLPQDLERAKRFAEDASNVDRVKRTLQQLKPFGASEKENFEEIEEDENNK